MSKNKKDAKSALKGIKKKTKKGKKHVYLLVDESGSMSGLEKAVVDGCNEFIKTFSKDKDAMVTIAYFDRIPRSDAPAILRVKVKNQKAPNVKQLVTADYVPRGMTPLNDAILQSVEKLDGWAKDDEPVFLAIITDGQENCSAATAEDVKRVLTDREEKEWSVVYIGANVDVDQVARDFGLTKQGQTFAFSNTNAAVADTMGTVSHLASVKTSGITAAQYDEEAKAVHEQTGGRLDGKK